MKKFFTLITAVLFAGSMMAEGLLFEQTYPGTPSSKTNGYEASFTLPTGDYTLTYANINNGSSKDSWDAVRAGRKSVASVATVTTEAIAAKVSKVVINFTQVDASKTNELCLLVADNEAFTDATKVPATIAKGEVSFTVAAPAENMYYQISMDMVAHGSSNGFNRWNKIQFITPEGGTPIVAPTYDTLTVAQAKEIAQALADKATSKEKYYVEGYAVNVEAYSLQYGNQNFYMVDDVKAPDNSFEAYAAYPTKNGKAYPVLAGDKVRAFGALKKYGTQLEIDHPTVEFITEVEGDRTIEQPAEAEVITVTKALEIGTALESGKTTTEYYEVQGYVTALTDNKGVANADGGWAAYKNQCMWIADAKDGGTAKETAFFVYQGVASEQVTKGAKISIKCQIKNYNGMVENAAAKAAVTILEKGEEPTPVDPTPTTLDTITVAKALEIGEKLENGKATDVQYVIKGYVSKIDRIYDAVNKNEDFWIVDEKGGTAASNADGAFYVYRGKPDTEKEVGLNAYVYVTTKIQKYGNANTIESWSNSPVKVVEQGEVEEIESIDVAKALEIGKTLADGGVSEKNYEITGYVSHIYTFFSADFKNETFFISDDPTSTSSENAFEVYRGKSNKAAEVGWGAKVKLTCKIKNYKGTIENDGSNVAFEVLEESTYEPELISSEKAAEIANALAEGAKTPKYYIVKGFIQEAGTFDTKNNTATYKLSDFPNDAEASVTAYKATVLKADAEKVATLNNYVNVTGYLMKHSTAQIAQGAITAFVEAPQMDTIHVDVAGAIAAGLELPMGGKSDRIYAVTGYVTMVAEEFSAGVESFFLADDAASEEYNFYAASASIAESVEAGKRVQVVGRLQNPDGEIITIEKGKASIAPAEGIENIVLTEKAQKVVVDGVIYIVRDNKLFNLQGAQVR